MSQYQRVLPPMTRRRFLQYSGSMALGGSMLAACAGTSNASTPSNPNLPSLTQWYHQYGEAGTHEAVLRYAKQYTKANVTVSWVPGVGNEYGDKVSTALLGSNPPDVFENSGLSLAQVKAGLLEPLDDIIADVKSDFKPSALAPFTVNGKVYGIKMITDPTFIYYRKSLFQKAGLQIPQTIDDLITAAKKLTNGNMKGIYLGPDSGVSALYEIAIWAAGGDLITEDNKVAFNTERVAAMYEKIHELNVSGGVLPDAPTFWWDSSSFQNGLCAMQWCGLWAMPIIQKGPIGNDFGIFPLPPLDSQSQPATIAGGWAEMVSAKSKNVEAAKEYVKWLWITNTQIQIDWNVGYGFHVPPRLSIAAKTPKLEQPPASDAVDILNKYGHAPSSLWDATMDNALQATASSIFKNGKNAMQLLNQTAEAVNAELQKELG